MKGGAFDPERNGIPFEPRETHRILNDSAIRLVRLADRHSWFAADRAMAITHFVKRAALMFPESKYRSQLMTEIEMRRCHIGDLLASVEITEPLYNTGTSPGHLKSERKNNLWDIEEGRKNLLRIKDQEIDTIGNHWVDVPYDMRMKEFVEGQEHLTTHTLSHAKAQIEMIDEALRLVTTTDLFTRRCHQPMMKHAVAICDFIESAVIFAHYTLIEVQSQHNDAYLGRDIQRPVFKKAYP